MNSLLVSLLLISAAEVSGSSVMFIMLLSFTILFCAYADLHGGRCVTRVSI